MNNQPPTVLDSPSKDAQLMAWVRDKARQPEQLSSSVKWLMTSMNYSKARANSLLGIAGP